MGADPPHGRGPRQLQTRGCKADNRGTAKDTVGRGGEYPPLVSVTKEAGFEEVGDYILKRQNMVA